MFEFGRELKRLFASQAPPRDGLTAGDISLLELLDLHLLRSECRAADVAAGRISAKDPAQRRLEAARVWRELARRTGDPVALRSAAQAAERAAQQFKSQNRQRAWAAARCEQALSAMLGAELYGDEGLDAAAEIALLDAQIIASSSPAGAIAASRLARLAAARLSPLADYGAVLKQLERFDAPLQALEGHLRGRTLPKAPVAQLRCDRAEMLMLAAARLKDVRLLGRAIEDLDRLSSQLDAAYEPLAWGRVQELRASARVAHGEMTGGVEDIADGVEMMVAALEVIGPDQSPLDWARLQHAMGVALQALGEASESDRAFVHALGCFDRAAWALRRQPALTLRSTIARNRVGCLARRAEISADVGLIDEAVDGLKDALARLQPSRDPVGWAIAQVSLAQLYEARWRLPGGVQAERAAAAVALNAALDVFAEHGLRAMTQEASEALQRLGTDRAPAR